MVTFADKTQYTHDPKARVLVSDVVSVTQDAVIGGLLDLIRWSNPHNLMGVRFYNDAAGEEANEVVPSGGSIIYTVKPITTNQFEALPLESNPSAAVPETVDVAAPPLVEAKATPAGITGATHWQLVLVNYPQA